VLSRETRRGVVCFVFYMTRRFSPLLSVICAVSMIEISFSRAIEWAYPGIDPFGGSGGAVVVVGVGEVLLPCWRFRFGPSLVEIGVFRLVSTGSFDWWCSWTFWVTIVSLQNFLVLLLGTQSSS
jgi:hypothetical protein